MAQHEGKPNRRTVISERMRTHARRRVSGTVSKLEARAGERMCKAEKENA